MSRYRRPHYIENTGDEDLCVYRGVSDRDVSGYFGCRVACAYADAAGGGAPAHRRRLPEEDSEEGSCSGSAIEAERPNSSCSED